MSYSFETDSKERIKEGSVAISGGRPVVVRESQKSIDDALKHAAEIDHKVQAFLDANQELSIAVKDGLWNGDIVIGTPFEALEIIGYPYVRAETATAKSVVFQPWKPLTASSDETMYDLTIEGGKVTVISRR